MARMGDPVANGEPSCRNTIGLKALTEIWSILCLFSKYQTRMEGMRRPLPASPLSSGADPPRLEPREAERARAATGRWAVATLEWSEEKELEWGRDSSLFQVRVERNFPSQGDNAFIALKVVGRGGHRAPPPARQGPVIPSLQVAERSAKGRRLRGPRPLALERSGRPADTTVFTVQAT